jgi:hypothetical protein
MTDKPESPNQPKTDNDTPPDELPSSSTSSDDDFGVESALAALGALADSPDTSEADEADDDETTAVSDVLPETEPADTDEPSAEAAAEQLPAHASDQAIEQPNDADTPAVADDDSQPDDDIVAPPPDTESTFSQAEASPYTPPEITPAAGDKLYRGQAASVVPALLLIGIGALLTFLLTTTDTRIDPLTGGALALMAAGVALLAHWLSSERRATGNLFTGLTLLTGGGLGAYALQSGVTLQTAWPLLLLIPGGALLATALIARRGLQQAALIGVLLLLAGAGGFVLTEFVF